MLQHLHKIVIQVLQDYGLDCKHHLVGQAYDRASAMSGKHTGVLVCIKTEAPLSFCVHCDAHCSNLVWKALFLLPSAETVCVCLRVVCAPKVAI